MSIFAIAIKKPPLPFIMEVTTTITPHSFSLPTINGGDYDYHVEWGDGQSDDITTYNDAKRTHSYATPASYDITISGTLKGWSFGTITSSRTLVTDIKQWGVFNHDNSLGAFRGCTGLTNISATDNIDLTGITSFEQFFYLSTNLATAPGMNTWDVSLITSMKYMFGSTSFNQNIAAWDVANVTDMFEMFGGTPFNQNIGGWDVGKVETFQNMFWSNTAFSQDISGWDVSSATAFNLMFFNADSFNQDISGWITSSLLTAGSMFSYCNIFDQDIGSWDVTNVTDLSNMFTGATLSTVNYDALLIGWEGQAVQDSVTLSGGNSKYSAGAAATARQALIDDHSWIITDGGQV